MAEVSHDKHDKSDNNRGDQDDVECFRAHYAYISDSELLSFTLSRFSPDNANPGYAHKVGEIHSNK